jgi:two-component system response regulator AtoC
VKILLAEDERNFGRVLEMELGDIGHEVDLVGDGVEAVLRLIDQPYDFALLDIKMPRLDGINALRIMKRLRPELIAITYSGNAGSGEMAESIRAGAVRCLTKPLVISQLREEIEHHAARRHGAAR